MELHTPRHNPYSDKERAKNDLNKQGYTLNLDVIDESTCKDNKGNTYSHEDLVINEICRIIDKNVTSNSTTLYAIVAKNGNKGIIKVPFAEQNEEVEKFLMNIDKGEDTKNNY